MIDIYTIDMALVETIRKYEYIIKRHREELGQTEVDVDIVIDHSDDANCGYVVHEDVIEGVYSSKYLEHITIVPHSKYFETQSLNILVCKDAHKIETAIGTYPATIIFSDIGELVKSVKILKRDKHPIKLTFDEILSIL